MICLALENICNTEVAVRHLTFAFMFLPIHIPHSSSSPGHNISRRGLCRDKSFNLQRNTWPETATWKWRPDDRDDKWRLCRAQIEDSLWLTVSPAPFSGFICWTLQSDCLAQNYYSNSKLLSCCYGSIWCINSGAWSWLVLSF